MLRTRADGRRPALAANTHAGPIVRVGPNAVIVSDPDVLRRMSAARSEYTRGPYYKAVRINPCVDNIFSMTDDGLHRELKSKMGPGVCVVLVPRRRRRRRRRR